MDFYIEINDGAEVVLFPPEEWSEAGFTPNTYERWQIQTEVTDKDGKLLSVITQFLGYNARRGAGAGLFYETAVPRSDAGAVGEARMLHETREGAMRFHKDACEKLSQKGGARGPLAEIVEAFHKSGMQPLPLTEGVLAALERACGIRLQRPGDPAAGMGLSAFTDYIKRDRYWTSGTTYTTTGTLSAGTTITTPDPASMAGSTEAMGHYSVYSPSLDPFPPPSKWVNILKGKPKKK